MAITFELVGDIIAACLLVKDLVDLLDNSHEPPGEFRSLIRELSDLERFLLRVHVMCRIHNAHPELRNLCSTAEQAVQDCQTSLNDLSVRVQKYVAHLREGGSGNVVKDAGMKLRWHNQEKDAILKFRNTIATHTGALNMSLASVNTVTLGSTATDRLADMRDAIELGNIRQENMLRQLQEGQKSFFLIWRTSIRNIMLSFRELQRMSTEMRHTILQLVNGNMEILKAIHEIQSGLPSAIGVQPPLNTVETQGASLGASSCVSQSITSEEGSLTEGTHRFDQEDPASDNRSTVAVCRFDPGFIIDGRTYSGNQLSSSSFLPNDCLGQERLDLLHVVSYMVHGNKLHLAPLENPGRVLDVGTGTGTWAIDMADWYPNADVLGIDRLCIQPQWVPENLRFEIEDVEQAWAIPPDSLDFVHIRDMDGAIQDWPHLMKEVYRTLKPGGWIEIKDIHWSYTSDDGSVTPEYAPLQMMETVYEALRTLNVKFHSSGNHHKRLTNVGFADISQQTHKVPVGPWSADPKLKQVGHIALLTAQMGIEDVILAPLRMGFGWNRDIIQGFAARVRQDLRKQSIHAYVFSYAIWARKPMD